MNNQHVNARIKYTFLAKYVIGGQCRNLKFPF